MYMLYSSGLQKLKNKKIITKTIYICVLFTVSRPKYFFLNFRIFRFFVCTLISDQKVSFYFLNRKSKRVVQQFFRS